MPVISQFEFDSQASSPPVQITTNMQLVEIQPRELKFIIEVKKQSSCTVHLANVTDQYIAFKVKTTSPKKYCVRPNVGIIKPKSTYSFTVTMQAQKSAPSEMLCKDKFLIQSTVVPFGTTEEEITPVMFVREGEKYIEETKLRVVLTSASNSPVSPVDGAPKQEASYDEALSPKEPNSPVLLPVNGLSKQERSCEVPIPEDKLHNRQLMKEEANKNVTNMEESSLLEATERLGPHPAKAEEFYPRKDKGSKGVKHVEEAKLKLVTDIEELKSKISAMDSKFIEAKHTIAKLNEEKSHTIQESEKLKQELAVLRRRSGPRKVRVGFPPLFVCMVALIALMIGFSFRA
ncbi:vesicle-associated protein 2-2 isoform X2 [Sesamum indicum]|uniref:Vesicle-associated protein 2-2 isoform X2 n=1 Tax=Sesamum indicum TaxID=4182 RepID=A0A8M8UWJ2_SESIN|nr:vesicle-associated protein 2-2 isoform X2 [Sesamum indicum]